MPRNMTTCDCGAAADNVGGECSMCKDDESGLPKTIGPEMFRLAGVGLESGQRWMCRDGHVRQILKRPNLEWYEMEGGFLVHFQGRCTLRSKDLMHLEGETRDEFLSRLNYAVGVSLDCHNLPIDENSVKAMA